MTSVSLDALSKTYSGGGSPAVSELSLEIDSGEMIALLGPSGCGKTTTLQLIAGLLQPTNGDIRFDDASVLDRKPEDRGAVMVFQNHLLFPYMNVADNVGFGLKMRNVAKAEIAARVADMLERVRLPDIGARMPSELSGGQQQRVALARALVVEPKVLLLDEPLSNLDAHLKAEMRDLIGTLQRSLGITTIMVTHDQEDAVVIADRVALLLDGRLKQFDRPEAFFSRPVDRATAQFFGGRNFVEGRSEGGVFDCVLGRIEGAGGRDGAGLLTIRPEAIRLGAGPQNTLDARLIERTFLGTQTRLRLGVGATEIEAIVPPLDAQSLRTGDLVTVHLPPEALWVMPPG